MTFLQALAGTNQGRVPVWFMRQAGRCLPTYVKEKQGRPLYDVFHDPDRIVTMTQLPFREGLDLDAAILFSDILTVLDGLGVPYSFGEQGPIISCSRVTSHQARYPSVMEAIQILKKQLSVPLIGFAGAPFTVLSFLIEGGASKNCLLTKRRFMESPTEMAQWIHEITEETIHYLDLQIEHGVDAIQLFDSAAHHLSPMMFRAWALPSLQKILTHLRGRIPTLVFSSASFLYLQDLIDLAPQGLSLYWNGSLVEAATRIPSTISVQGNLDPSLLFGSTQQMDEVITPWLCDPHLQGRWIFNLGHGLLPQTPFDQIRWLVDTVHQRSLALWNP